MSPLVSLPTERAVHKLQIDGSTLLDAAYSFSTFPYILGCQGTPGEEDTRPQMPPQR